MPQPASTPRPTLLVFVLGPDERRVRTLLRRAARRGLDARLVCPSYDLDLGDTVAGRPVARPMDYLDASDIDEIYRAVFEWQRSLPATVLGDGRTAYEAASPDGEPTTIWSWLYRLYPHMHLRIRLVRTVLAVMQRERPACVALAGTDEAFAWQRDIIVRTIDRHHPGVAVDPVLLVERLRRAIRFGGARPRYAGGHGIDAPVRRVGRLMFAVGAAIALAIVNASLWTWDGATRLALGLVDGVRQARVVCTSAIRFGLTVAEGWIMRGERRLRLDRLGRPRARPGSGTASRLTPGLLRGLMLYPPRHLTVRQGWRPVHSGEASFTWVEADRTVRVETRGEDYRIRWPRVGRWRYKTSLKLVLRDLRTTDAHLLVTIDNGGCADALRIDASGLRLRSSGLPVPLPAGETTIVFSLYRSKTTVTVDGVERLRARAGDSAAGEAGVALEIHRTAPTGQLSMDLALARIIDQPKPQRWDWPRRRRRRAPRVIRRRPVAPRAPAGPSSVQVAAARQLADLEARAARFAGGDFAGHALVLLSGRKGSQWFYSRRRGQWFLWDEYIEYVPDALLEHCRTHRWRLTVLFLGEPPAFTAERPSYAERHPDFVDELSTLDIRDVLAERRREPPEGDAALAGRLLDDDALAAAFSDQGVRFFDQVRDLVGETIETLGLNFLSQAHGWREVFARLRPDVVFGGRLEHKHAINVGAHDAGARTVTVKLGISEEMLPSVIAVRPDGTFDRPFFPDLFLVWGPAQQAYLRSRLPELDTEIGVSGRTRSDSFINEARELDTADIRRRLGYEPDDDVVIFGATCRTRYGLSPGAPWGACCMSPASYRACLQALLELHRRFPALRVMVKPHPADDVDMIRDMIDDLGSPRLSLVTRDMGFHNSELLAVSKLFASSVSSMFAEAVISGRVAVNVWTPDVNYLYEQARCELYGSISETVRDVESLGETVARLLEDEASYEQALARARLGLPWLFGEVDGRNAQRAVEQGLALVAERPDIVVTPRSQPWSAHHRGTEGTEVARNPD